MTLILTFWIEKEHKKKIHGWVCTQALLHASSRQTLCNHPALVKEKEAIVSGRVRGQCLPHTCWERYTTISLSPNGSCGHPRSSEPPRCHRLPPEREEMHGGGGAQRMLLFQTGNTFFLRDTRGCHTSVGAWDIKIQAYFTPKYSLKCGNKIY